VCGASSAAGVTTARVLEAELTTVAEAELASLELMLGIGAMAVALFIAAIPSMPGNLTGGEALGEGKPGVDGERERLAARTTAVKERGATSACRIQTERKMAAMSLKATPYTTV